MRQIGRRVAWSIGVVVIAGALSGVRAAASDGDNEIVVTFTKWVTSGVDMAGVVAGASGPGTFSGRILAAQNFAPDFPIFQLDAIYRVQGSGHSFTALIRGGSSLVTGRGTLNGAILDGWLTGADVHVEFDTIPTCSGNPAGPCFRGTIHIRPSGRDVE